MSYSVILAPMRLKVLTGPFASETELLATLPAVLWACYDFTVIAALSFKHFDFFGGPPEGRDPTVRKEIREILIWLWQTVGDRLPSPLGGQLGEIYAGDINANDWSGWAQNRREGGPEAVNLTIEIDATDVHINVVGGTKPQAALLEAWLRSKEARAFWRSHDDFELVFFRRSAHAKGAKPVWQGARWDLIRSYSAAEVARTGFSSLRIELERDLNARSEHLAYHVRRKWPMEVAVGSPEPWLEELTRCAEVLLPVARGANTQSVW